MARPFAKNVGRDGRVAYFTDLWHTAVGAISKRSRMMAKAYRHMKLGSIRQVSDFARQRLHEINKVFDELGSEKDMWEKVIMQLGACPKCLGEKTVRVYLADEEVRIDKCPDCNGSGRTSTSPPSFPN